MRRPFVIGHRGASGHAPENTMAAFRQAVAMGAGFIETDLHLSRDARFVAIHDGTLERTTNGHGRVQDHTLAELCKLDAGSWFDPRFAAERIPTIEEIFAFAREADVVFYLEIKYQAAWGLHHALAGALRGAAEAARAVVISFDSGTLDNVRRLDATLMTGLLFDFPRSDIVDVAQSVGARQIAPRGDLLSPELVERAHQADLQVVVWTLNDPADMRAAIASGVDGIMTDFPDRLTALLNS